jgi:hypothetical protein
VRAEGCTAGEKTQALAKWLSGAILLAAPQVDAFCGEESP